MPDDRSHKNLSAIGARAMNSVHDQWQCQGQWLHAGCRPDGLVDSLEVLCGHLHPIRTHRHLEGEAAVPIRCGFPDRFGRIIYEQATVTACMTPPVSSVTVPDTRAVCPAAAWVVAATEAPIASGLKSINPNATAVPRKQSRTFITGRHLDQPRLRMRADQGRQQRRQGGSSRRPRG